MRGRTEVEEARVNGASILPDPVQASTATSCGIGQVEGYGDSD